MSQTLTPDTSTRTTPAWVAWAALGVVYVVWGSTYLAIRFTVASMPPLLSGGLRFVVAGLVLGAAVLVFAGRRALRLNLRQVGSAVLIGLLLPAWGNGMVVIAEQHVASGVAALLVAAVPLYVVVFRRLLGERPPLVTFAGVTIGMAGLALLLLAGPSSGAHGSAGWGRGWCCWPRSAGRSGRWRAPGFRCRPTRSRSPRWRWCPAAPRWRSSG